MTRVQLIQSAMNVQQSMRVLYSATAASLGKYCSILIGYEQKSAYSRLTGFLPRFSKAILSRSFVYLVRNISLFQLFIHEWKSALLILNWAGKAASNSHGMQRFGLSLYYRKFNFINRSPLTTRTPNGGIYFECANMNAVIGALLAGWQLSSATLGTCSRSDG